MTDKNLKTFIISILEKLQLNEKHISMMTDDESMKLFSKAFIHKSFDQRNNYELLEFRGDAVVNYTVSQYLLNRFPKVVSIKYLTRIKHNYVSKDRLSEFSKSIKLDQFLKIKHNETVNNTRLIFWETVVKMYFAGKSST